MDASSIFNSLLRSIEESQLNYSMSRTAFSDTSSLKWSFSKKICRSLLNWWFLELVQLNKNAKQLEDENLKLQIEIKALENTDSDQKKGIEELVRVQLVYELKKEKSKVFENKLAEFREEVLKLKQARICNKLRHSKNKHKSLHGLRIIYLKFILLSLI